MEAKIREIQPMAIDVRVMPEQKRKESQAVPPVMKGEGGLSQKVGKGKKDNQEDSFTFVSQENIEQATEEVNSFLKDLKKELNFKVEEKSGEVIVQVVDQKTGDVIRQLPPDSVLKLREKLKELRGVLFEDVA